MPAPIPSIKNSPTDRVKFKIKEQVTKKNTPWYGNVHVMAYKRVRVKNVRKIKYLLTDLCWYYENELLSLAEAEALNETL